MPRSGQVAVALGVFALGAGIAAVTFTQVPEATGYAKIGPRLMPTLVAIGLVLLSLLLLKEAFFGGFRGVEETAVESTDWRAFAWVSAGLIANGLLIVPAGFVIAGTVLFMLAARAFAGGSWARNALVGVVLSAATYALFSYGLGLQLPRGILPF